VDDVQIPLDDGATYLVRGIAARVLSGTIHTKAGAEIVDVAKGSEAILLRRVELLCGNTAMPRALVMSEANPARVALHHFRYGKRATLTVFLDLRGDEESPYGISDSVRAPVLHGPLSLAEVLEEIRSFQANNLAARARKHAGDHDSL